MTVPRNARVGVNTLPRRFCEACGQEIRKVDVRDFGAMCDGTTDDSFALEAAFAYAQSVGGAAIFLPHGLTVGRVTVVR